MTAQVAILNRKAIALATESASTSIISGVPKIYFENKLFQLSKYHPVAIMIYQKGDFMGIPWETVIKMYRNERQSDKPLKHLEDYADDLFSFLATHTLLTDIQRARTTVLEIAQDYIKNLVNRTIEAVREKSSEAGFDPKNIPLFAQAFIDNENTAALGRKQIAPETSHLVLRQFTADIDKVITDKAENLPLTDKLVAQTRDAIFNIVTSDFYGDSVYSGIVIAGFGSEDIFPRLANHRLQGCFGGWLKHERLMLSANIGEQGAQVIPFAQREMVCRFMDGLDPDIMKFLRVAVPTIIGKHIQKICATPATGPQQEHLKYLSNAVKEITRECFDQLLSFQFQEFIGPVMEIVTQLPKDELARMAEALVSLTTFKRHVSIQHETAGGPVDVAVISKGDGFVWIKRKHYFQAELNPHFLYNYFDRSCPYDPQ